MQTVCRQFTLALLSALLATCAFAASPPACKGLLDHNFPALLTGNPQSLCDYARRNTTRRNQVDEMSADCWIRCAAQRLPEHDITTLVNGAQDFPRSSAVGVIGLLLSRVNRKRFLRRLSLRDRTVGVARGVGRVPQILTA